MHAIKGAWAGRTYALANSNDSGGKKPRIRLSKEERKELVVSFIKRHQKLNNGSFPSLNLTHKEVGGSFYTVREIVREVIQENRVLAPPKLLPGEQEQNMESFLEQYPLGSISIDPQIDVVSSNESQVVVNHQQLASKDWVMDSRPIIDLDQGTHYNETFVNGSVYADAETEFKGASNIVEEVGEVALSPEEHNIENFMEPGPIESSSIALQIDVESSDAETEFKGASNIVEEVGEVALSPEEHSMENFMEQGPIESSSIALQIDVESLDESEIGVDYHKSTNEEQVLDPAHVSKSDQGSYVNEAIVNGSSNVGEVSSSPQERDVENFMEQGPTTISTIDRQIDVELVDESESGNSYNNTTNEELVLDATHILKSDQGSVVNETTGNGSSKAVSKSEEFKELVDGESLLEIDVDGDKAEVKELEVYPATSQTEESLVVETFPLRPVPCMDYDSDEELNKAVVSVGALKNLDTEGLQVEAVTSSVPEKALLTKDSTVRDVNGSTDLDTKDTLPTANKPNVAANGILQQATSDKAAPNKKQFDTSNIGSSKTKGSETTLNRPKLESWEATTDKSAGKEGDKNPLMAFFKAFVTAFVKFWSE